MVDLLLTTPFLAFSLLGCALAALPSDKAGFAANILWVVANPAWIVYHWRRADWPSVVVFSAFFLFALAGVVLRGRNLYRKRISDR